jgi:hypothetical protein
MNPTDHFVNAGAGWWALALWRPGWQGKFVTTRRGFLVALGFYFAIVAIAILVQGIFAGVPSIPELLFGLVFNGLPLLAALFALWGTIVFLGIKVPQMSAMVPVTYAMTFFLLAGIVIASLIPAAAFVLLAILAYLLYRAGREILGISVVFALAYAALSIVLLVALPMSLYMLFAPAPGA